ncbi:MAG: hypothetical protein SCI25_14685 [Desulfuromonadales bacterium]|nr:hypothetical protein [Desulfuromonadales bacterium]
MQLNKSLLQDFYEYKAETNELKSCWNALGLYNSMQFVLRLRPDIHRLIDGLPNGIVTSGEIDFESIQAYSTFLHETIHWWQHSGSTIGLLSSLTYPVQTHKISENLKKYLEITGPKKPITNYNFNNAKDFLPADQEFKEINQILNDFFDIEFFKEIITFPKSTKEIADNPLFECIGHSCHITYASILRELSAIFDEELEFLPDVTRWNSGFKKLTDDKAIGYHHGSPIYLPPVGTREIFEGQARFNQIQFLYFSSGKSLEWGDFEDLGMLNGVYVEAFNVFLKTIKKDRPPTIEDPIVGLFLIICDISINPTDGFPFDIFHFDSFVMSVDPGTRFYMMCELIRDKFQDLTVAVQEYLASEYYYITKLLCDELVCHTPLEAASLLVKWSEKSEKLQQLMQEDETFKFSDVNLPIRVLISRFIKFNIDKLKRPEFFCWPGVWSTGDRCSSDIRAGSRNLNSGISG